MARNGAGTFNLVAGNPVVTGTPISSTWANNTLSDIAGAITQSISADGQTPVTGNLPMSGFKHTNAAAASLAGQYLVYGQAAAQLGANATLGANAVLGASPTLGDGTTIGTSSGGSLTVTNATVTASNGLAFTGGSIKMQGAANYATANSQMSIGVDSGNPTEVWCNSAGAADSKMWRAFADASNWYLRLLNDANSASADAIVINRTGVTVNSINLKPTTLQYNGTEVGFRSVPQNAQTAAYTLVAADRGTHISITTGGVTVPAGVFNTGDAVSIYNNSGSSQTITQGASVTMYLAGTATTGNRTLVQHGVCTVLCVAANTFVVSGGGLS